MEFALLAPIMVFLLFAMLDLARVYTAMSSVESAAREAADFATSLGADKWSSTNIDITIPEMKRRACIAASDLHDYDWHGYVFAGGWNRRATARIRISAPALRAAPAGRAWTWRIPLNDPAIDALVCYDDVRDPPCTVTVTMGHTFHLFVPFQLDFFGVKLGLPVTLPFERDSTFAMTDIEVAP